MTEVNSFPQSWSAEVLTRPPLIAPAWQFTYPRAVAGEEDALARGALQVMVHPAEGGSFLANCALGFTDRRMPTGVHACPNPRELCAVAGGYAYIIDTTQPERSTHISQKPVVEVRALPAEGLMLFVGFHSVTAWGVQGLAWQSERLSWEGVRITAIESGVLHGFGWNMFTDKEVAFALDLRTGKHEGGGYAARGNRE